MRKNRTKTKRKKTTRQNKKMKNEEKFLSLEYVPTTT